MLSNVGCWERREKMSATWGKVCKSFWNVTTLGVWQDAFAFRGKCVPCLPLWVIPKDEHRKRVFSQKDFVPPKVEATGVINHPNSRFSQFLGHVFNPAMLVHILTRMLPRFHPPPLPLGSFSSLVTLVVSHSNHHSVLLSPQITVYIYTFNFRPFFFSAPWITNVNSSAERQMEKDENTPSNPRIIHHYVIWNRNGALIWSIFIL